MEITIPKLRYYNRAVKSRKMGMSSGGKARIEHEWGQQGQPDKAAELDGR